LNGEIGRDQAIARGQQATRNYAKRQYTWFAHQPPPEWPRVNEPTSPVRAELVEALSLPLPDEA
jgi:tRNA dimethylallyltransferase